MEIRIQEVDNNVVIATLDGGLDRETSAELLDDLHKMVDAGLKKIIVDMDRVTFISSAGLAMIIRLHAKLKKKGGIVRLANVHDFALDLLRVTNLHHVLEIYEDVNAAKLAFRDE